jgi:hypothetical protein
MPVPTSYTEETLIQFMHSTLAEMATVLGWTVDGGHYDEAVVETLLVYGVSQIAEASDIRKLRACARVQVWQAVSNATAGDYDYEAEDVSYSRSQVHAQASAMLEKTLLDAMPYTDVYSVVIDEVIFKNDPYVYIPDEERT